MNDFDTILESEATEWVVKMTDPGVTETTRNAFEDWLKTSSRHQRIYDEILTDWQVMPIAEAAAELGKQSLFIVMFRNKAVRFALPVLLLAIFIGMSPVFSPEEVTTEYYQTTVGGSRSIALADGSKIILNTETNIEVTYSEEERHVKLVQGEAFFDVARAPERPFVVDTMNGKITVLGTKFSVSSFKKDETSVVVSSGRVRVQERDRSWNSEVLTRDQAISIVEKNLSKVNTVKSDDLLAWQDGWVVFNNEPLDQVLATLQRYSTSSYEYNARELRNFRVTGSFNLETPVEILSNLSVLYPIEIDRNTDQITIHAKK